MNNYKGGIYTISVTDIGIYYGETDNILRRWIRHRKQLYSGKHANIKLRRAFMYFGIEAFTFSILEQSDALENSKQFRLFRELQLITQDPLCLNIRGNQEIELTPGQLPNRPAYRNKKITLQRVQRQKFALVIETDTGKKLGVETFTGKMRLGTFYSDQNCKITRI